MRLRIAVIVSVLFGHMVALELLVPAVSQAAGSSVVISGFQNPGTVNSTDDLIELANLLNHDISLSGWQVQYRAASNGTDCTKGWIPKTTLTSGTITAGGHYLFAPIMDLGASATLSAGLPTLGAVRLLDASKLQQDALAWGASSCGTGRAAAVPPAGQSLKRRTGAQGSHGDNAADFFIQPLPTPHVSATTFATSPGTATVKTSSPAVTSAIKITELLIDSVAPATDLNGEFVELHNAGSEAVDLKGYGIKTGTHTYVIPSGLIDADGYMVFTSGGTTISLTDSGGVADLLNPRGVAIDTAGAWGAVVPGASWAFINNAWVWTMTPTPGAANIYATAAATNSAKVKAAAVTKAKTAAKPEAVEASKLSEITVKPLIAASSTPSGRWLLYLLASLTIAYIMYEFRYDFRNFYFKFRGYPSGSPTPIPVPLGRRSDRAPERPRRR